jgi:RHH-type transcriptional regulator, rel operon repressor / antitoxin RelB
MLPVRLPAQLEKLSKRTGKPKSTYVKRALAEFLQEQEDYLIAISRLEDDLPGIPLAEVARKLGLEDSI